jgi:LAO/AO transport system kinase
VLGRAISVAENGGERWQRLLGLLTPDDDTSVIGFTGAPGSGKSTLIDALITELRGREKTVAVVAIDPSSPFSGGAVLGDRCRMNRHQGDQGVYIRSLSARGSVGGLSAGAGRVVDVLKSGSFDLVVIETVGTGQSEVDILELADMCILICAPNSGDDIQAIKSGICEIADILVVNKSDLDGADRTIQQLIMARNLPANAARKVPVLSTVATQGTGVPGLVDRILARDGAARTAPPDSKDLGRIHRRLARTISRDLEQHLLNSGDQELTELCDLVQRGQYSFRTAALAWMTKRKL